MRGERIDCNEAKPNPDSRIPAVDCLHCGRPLNFMHQTRKWVHERGYKRTHDDTRKATKEKS